MNKKWFFIIVFIIFIIAICMIVGINYYFNTSYGNSREQAGQFGDMFGVVNAFASMCAFAGLIYTILLQREDLKSQRDDSARLQFESIFSMLYNLFKNDIEKFENINSLPTSDMAIQKPYYAITNYKR